jgi:hypothetical protein
MKAGRNSSLLCCTQGQGNSCEGACLHIAVNMNVTASQLVSRGQAVSGHTRLLILVTYVYDLLQLQKLFRN